MSSARRTTKQYLEDRGTLKRSLGVVAIVALGLGYMTPTVVFDTFGIVSRISDGVVPLAYVFALVVMIFTAISYGKMVQVFPDAGSAYSYTRKTMGEYPGFFVGWLGSFIGLFTVADGECAYHSYLHGASFSKYPFLDLGHHLRYCRNRY